MVEPSASQAGAVAEHREITVASLPALRAASVEVELAVLQLDLEVKRLRAYGGDATVATDPVAQWTARLDAVRREILADATSIALKAKAAKGSAR